MAETPVQIQEQKPTDKEHNFRQLEAKYQKQLEQERQGRLDAEKRAQDLSQRSIQEDNEDEDEAEPYVDKKKLTKTLKKFEQESKKQTVSDIQNAIKQAQDEAKKEAWLENNADFYDVLQNHAGKLAEKSPALVKSILAMPESFERQKLVYQNIKELGLHKEPEKQPSIQDKIDSNRRGSYYQPTGVGSSPYKGPQGDFSPQGQKDAYQKMQELKRRIQGG